MYDRNELIAFESRVADHWRAGDINSLFHLSGGNEDELIAIFQNVKPGDYVFSTHRSHYHALLKGVRPDTLMDTILDGRSMFVFSREHRFLSSSVLGGTCGVAAGVALAIKLKGEPHRVWCFVGDGASDNGHLYEAVRYADSLDLPVAFILEDNGKSCDSTRAMRGATANIINSRKLVSYSYTPTYPHCQAPSEGQIQFKRG